MKQDITVQTNGAPRHERLIAETVLMREHETAHLHALVLQVAHQVVAIRHFRDKYKIGTGGTWLDSYTNRFVAGIERMLEVKEIFETLKSELDGLETDIVAELAKELQKAKKAKEQSTK